MSLEADLVQDCCILHDLFGGKSESPRKEDREDMVTNRGEESKGSQLGIQPRAADPSTGLPTDGEARKLYPKSSWYVCLPGISGWMSPVLAAGESPGTKYKASRWKSGCWKDTSVLLQPPHTRQVPNGRTPCIPTRRSQGLWLNTSPF